MDNNDEYMALSVKADGTNRRFVVHARNFQTALWSAQQLAERDGDIILGIALAGKAEVIHLPKFTPEMLDIALPPPSPRDYERR